MATAWRIFPSRICLACSKLQAAICAPPGILWRPSSSLWLHVGYHLEAIGGPRGPPPGYHTGEIPAIVVTTVGCSQPTEHPPPSNRPHHRAAGCSEHRPPSNRRHHGSIAAEHPPPRGVVTTPAAKQPGSILLQRNRPHHPMASHREHRPPSNRRHHRR